jgi:hypothetical protein
VRTFPHRAAEAAGMMLIVVAVLLTTIAVQPAHRVQATAALNTLLPTQDEVATYRSHGLHSGGANAPLAIMSCLSWRIYIGAPQGDALAVALL